MSTQLILYPQTLLNQNYQGYTSSLLGGTSEWVVDGINFTSINSATQVVLDTSVFGLNAKYTEMLINHPPTPINTWFTFRSDGGGGGGVPAYPTQVGNRLVLDGAASFSWSGVYQRLDNLTPGGVYTVTILATGGISAFGGKLLIRHIITDPISLVPYSVEILGQSAPLTSASHTYTATFTAQGTNDGIMVVYNAASSTEIKVEKISVQNTAGTPSLIYGDLQDGQVICDLYQEEDIPLSLSIDDFKNVAEQIKSYSKDFNLPATKRNNRIFNNMFEITRSDDGLIFNAYVRTECVLKQDGFILFKGYLRMIDIKDKEGEISYNVNLYSEIVTLADTLKDLTMRDLHLDELEHVYDFENIKKSWDDSVGLPLAHSLNPSSFAYDPALGFDNTNVLKYPLIDWEHDMEVSLGGTPIINSLESNFRPCIQVKYLIDKIFSSTNQFTYTSDFFNTTVLNSGFDFDKLFMDFNWGSSKTPPGVQNNGVGKYEAKGAADNYAAAGSWTTCLLTEDTFPPEQGYDISTGVFTIPAGQQNTAFEVEYKTTFLCVKTTTFKTRWKHTTAAGLTFYYDESAFTPIVGSATANPHMDCDLFGNPFYNASVESVTIKDGGHYFSAPTVEFIDPPTEVNNLAAAAVGGVATLTGNAVTAVDLVQSSYPHAYNFGYSDLQAGCATFTGGTLLANSQPPRITFNQVNPFYEVSGTFVLNLEPGDTLEFEMLANDANSIRQSNRVNYKSYPQYTSNVSVSSTVSLVASAAILDTIRGDLGQWDFLKGIMTMFNLVSLVDDDNPNNILIEPYRDVFIDNTRSNDLTDLSLSSRFNGKIHDWTDKVDVAEMELNPLTDLNKETVFQFEEDDEDYCFNQYKASAPSGEKLYGSFLWNADEFTVLAGKTEIIASPFAATVISPLMTQYTDFILPKIYAYNDDGDCEGFGNAPRIFYNAGVHTLTSTTYSVPDHPGGSTYPTEDTFLQFGHLSAVPPLATTIDFNFGTTELVGFSGILPVNNLFNVYWLPYFAELYHPDTRTVKLKVNLNASDIATFKFYDKVMIKNRTFRVNKIEYKPNSLAKVEFILIP